MSRKKKFRCDTSGWVEAYSDQLFRYAFLRINNREDAEDLVQETFLSGIKGLDNFRGDCTEKTWLFNIINRKIIDYYRKKSTHASSNTVSIEADPELFFKMFFKDKGALGHWRADATPSDWGKQADADLESSEFMNILQLCMSRLPALWCSVFRMKNLEEKENKEICKDLSISASNLWVIIHRAKLQLRGCLEKEWIKA